MSMPPATKPPGASAHGWASAGDRYGCRMVSISTTLVVARTVETGSFGCSGPPEHPDKRRRIVVTRSKRGIRIHQRKRARLRLGVLRLGALLGWGPRDVIGFA